MNDLTFIYVNISPETSNESFDMSAQKFSKKLG